MQFQILGDDMQAIHMTLEPGQKVYAEAGSMLYMTDSIQLKTTMNTKDEGGLLGGIMSGLKRAVAGESFFVTMFEANHSPGEVVFSASYPGKIIHCNLKETGPLLCQRDAFLCAEPGVDISIAFTQRIGAGFFGGEGFILQKLSGQGHAFIHAGGLILTRDLAPGESLRVDTGCLVAFTEGVDYDIQMASGIKTMFFGGEGLFYARLKGPGRVYLQSVPFSRMADKVLAAANFGRADAGSNPVSSGVGGLFNGIFGEGD